MPPVRFGKIKSDAVLWMCRSSNVSRCIFLFSLNMRFILIFRVRFRFCFFIIFIFHFIFVRYLTSQCYTTGLHIRSMKCLMDIFDCWLLSARVQMYWRFNYFPLNGFWVLFFFSFHSSVVRIWCVVREIEKKKSWINYPFFFFFEMLRPWNGIEDSSLWCLHNN